MDNAAKAISPPTIPHLQSRLEQLDFRPRTLLRPLLVVLYLAAVVYSVQVVDRTVIYPLDDSYIHMAIARTLVNSGVWGVEPSSWAAASSSPLFTLILAGLYAIWPSEVDFSFAPLVVNVLAGIGLIYAIDTLVGSLLLLFLALPLIPLTLLGMEHTLDALLALMLVSLGIEALRDQRPRYWLVGSVSAAAATCRYESVVLVLFLCLFAAIVRRWLLLIVLALSATVPLLALGYLWHRHGGWFEPNSILVKASVPTGFHTLFSKLQWMFSGKWLASALTVTVLATLTAGLTILIARRRGLTSAVLFGIIAVASGAAQLVAGQVGWLYRYEAWVLVLNTVACLTLLPGPLTVVAVGAILLPRAYLDARDTPLASQDRLLEHFAPAHFVARNFPGQTVVVNDIGIMAWLSPAPLLDIYGLASNEPVLMRKVADYKPKAVDQWTRRHNAQIAVLQTCWPDISDVTPSTWDLIETWHIPRNTVFNDFTIGFYALTAESAASLRRDLATYPVPLGVSRVSLPEKASVADVRKALNCRTSS